MNNKAYEKCIQYSNLIVNTISIARRDFTKIQFNAFMGSIGKMCLSETDDFILQEVLNSFKERLNKKK